MPKNWKTRAEEPGGVHRQSFHFDTRGHRTGVHTDEFTRAVEPERPGLLPVHTCRCLCFSACLVTGVCGPAPPVPARCLFTGTYRSYPVLVHEASIVRKSAPWILTDAGLWTYAGFCAGLRRKNTKCTRQVRRSHPGSGSRVCSRRTRRRSARSTLAKTASGC